jgi:hypothetical protein
MGPISFIVAHTYAVSGDSLTDLAIFVIINEDWKTLVVIPLLRVIVTYLGTLGR